MDDIFLFYSYILAYFKFCSDFLYYMQMNAKLEKIGKFILIENYGLKLVER